MKRLIITGNPRPVIGRKEWYSVSSVEADWLMTPSEAVKNPLQPMKTEWGIMVQTRAGWKRARNDKEGETVPYTFGQKSLLHKGIRIVVRQGDREGELTVYPQRAKKPEISRVELLDVNYQPIPKGKKLSYRDTIIARAYCVEMFKMQVSFTLWEDDAKGAGHHPVINALNRINSIPVLGSVDLNGIAEAVFRLPAYTMAVHIANVRTAAGDRSEGALHEYYVTADVVSASVEKASPNINVVNPAYVPPPPRQRTWPVTVPVARPPAGNPKPVPGSPKFPVTTGGRSQSDGQRRILSAEFVDTGGNRLHASRVGTDVIIKITAKEMKNKKVQVKIWEEDTLTWTNDLLYEKEWILTGDENYIGARLTKKMFDKANDGGHDSRRQDYFIEVLYAETSVTSAVMEVTQDAMPTPVVKGKSVSVVEVIREEKKEKGKCPRCDKDIALEQIKQIFPDCKDEARLRDVMNAYNKYMSKFKMNTCWNKAHFFAQTRIESGTSLNFRNESFNYSTRRLIYGDYTKDFLKGNLSEKIPGHYTSGKFNPRPFSYFDKHHDQAEKYGRKDVNKNNDCLIQKAQPEEIANLVYGPDSKKGKELKNTLKGDGWLFKGRGFIQLTGRGNYSASNKYTVLYANVEIISQEGADKVGTNAEVAMIACMGYWVADERKIQVKANGQTDSDAISKLIGVNVDWAGKKKTFNEITSKLFQIGDCMYGKKYDIDKKGDKNQYDINVDTFEVEKVSTKVESNIFEYNVYKNGRKIKTYIITMNHNKLLPFPESGPNWGRFGRRDKGGDNWIDEKVCAALLGFFYSLPYNGFRKLLYYNDISANDGRNIGHTGHTIAGNDIDIRYPGSSNRGQTFWKDAMRAYKDESSFVLELENILSIGKKWKFVKNYAYKKGIKNTMGTATNVHQDHFHLGYRE